MIRIAALGAATTIPVQGASTVSGIAAGSDGNIYLTDVGDHDQIVMVTADGRSAPFAGNNGYGFGGDGGPALKAILFGPVGLAMDNNQNLLIADSSNGRIRRVLFCDSWDELQDVQRQFVSSQTVRRLSELIGSLPEAELAEKEKVEQLRSRVHECAKWQRTPSLVARSAYR